MQRGAGAKPLHLPGRPEVSGAAASAPTRGGSRKKIGYNEQHTEQGIFQKSLGSQQFSCTYRCASEGRRNTKVDKDSKLLVAAYKCR